MKKIVLTFGSIAGAILSAMMLFTLGFQDTIDFEVTVEDPVMYAKPFANKRVWRLRPDWELMEYSCMENNKDLLEGHIKSLPSSEK